MKVLISGASGFIGSRIRTALEAEGHITGALVRRPVVNPEREVYWNPEERSIDNESMSTYDAVLHLAGKNIADDLWTESYKTQLRSSRVDGTSLIATTMALLGENGPQTLVSASAIGFYGDRGTELLDESSRPGQGFLPDLCREWESATLPALEAGIRVVIPRIGIVLSREGGFLAPLVPMFKVGLGARLGSGEQQMSWVHLRDVLRALHELLTNEAMSGIYNVVAPNPVDNRHFTQALATKLHRPAFLRVPEKLLKWLPGGMGKEMMLASQRVQPTKLLDAGFRFRSPDIESALAACFRSN